MYLFSGYRDAAVEGELTVFIVLDYQGSIVINITCIENINYIDKRR